MRKVTMPNFCINFLNKAAKLLPILYDFAVASLADAWIKINKFAIRLPSSIVAFLADAWIKIVKSEGICTINHGRIPRGCVELLHFTENLIEV